MPDPITPAVEADAAPVGQEAEVAVPAVHVKETPITEDNFEEQFDAMFAEESTDESDSGAEEKDDDPDPDEKEEDDDPDPDGDDDDPDPDPDADDDEKEGDDDPDPDADDDEKEEKEEKDDDEKDEDEKEEKEEKDDDEKDEDEDDSDDDLTKPDSTRKTKSGSEEWVYSKSRGKKLHAGYARAREAEEIMGEELTTEAIEARDAAFRDKGWMNLDFISGNPEDQAKVFSHYFSLGKAAVESGEAGEDPSGSAIGAFMTAAEAAAPEAVAEFHRGLMPTTLASALKRIYQKAHAAKDENLFNAAANLDETIFGRHQTFEGYTPPTAPAKVADTRGEEAKAEKAAASSARFARFSEKTNESVGANVTAEIEAAIKPYEKHYKKFPQRLKNITVRLRTEIRDAIQQDDKFRQANELLFSQAERAVSETVLNDSSEKIAARYGVKAKKVVKGLVRQIMSEDADHLKTSTEAKKKRLKAQQHKRKSKAESVVQAKVPKTDKSTVDKEDWAEMIDSL